MSTVATLSPELHARFLAVMTLDTRRQWLAIAPADHEAFTAFREALIARFKAIDASPDPNAYLDLSPDERDAYDAYWREQKQG